METLFLGKRLTVGDGDGAIDDAAVVVVVDAEGWKASCCCCCCRCCGWVTEWTGLGMGWGKPCADRTEG